MEPLQNPLDIARVTAALWLTDKAADLREFVGAGVGKKAHNPIQEPSLSPL